MISIGPGGSGTNPSPFAAAFVAISFCWHQQKRQKSHAEGSLPWVEFEAFLRKKLDDSSVFVVIILT